METPENMDKLREACMWKEAHKAAVKAQQLVASADSLEAKRSQLRCIVDWLLNCLERMGEYEVPFEPEEEEGDGNGEQ